MTKHFCDLCNREAHLVSLVRVREFIPLTKAVEDVCFSNKELCAECAEEYFQRFSRTIVEVWENMCHDKKMVEQVR